MVGINRNGLVYSEYIRVFNGFTIRSLVGFIMERPIRMESGSGPKERAGSGAGWIHGPMYGDTIRVVGFIPLAFVRDDPLGGTIKTNPTLSGREREYPSSRNYLELIPD